MIKPNKYFIELLENARRFNIDDEIERLRNENNLLRKRELGIIMYHKEHLENRLNDINERLNELTNNKE